MPILVRRATPSDADHISAIAATVQTFHAAALPSVFQAQGRASLPAALVVDLLGRPSHYFWVAQRSEVPEGYLYAELQQRAATLVKLQSERLYIHQMGVLPVTRFQGLGSALFDAVREFARDAGIKQLALDVWEFNADARGFYERRGFAIMKQELWSELTDE